MLTQDLKPVSHTCNSRLVCLASITAPSTSPGMQDHKWQDARVTADSHALLLHAADKINFPQGYTFCFAGANAMALSLKAGKRVTLSKVDAFADGVAVKQACGPPPKSPCSYLWTKYCLLISSWKCLLELCRWGQRCTGCALACWMGQVHKDSTRSTVTWDASFLSVSELWLVIL